MQLELVLEIDVSRESWMAKPILSRQQTVLMIFILGRHDTTTRQKVNILKIIFSEYSFGYDEQACTHRFTITNLFCLDDSQHTQTIL